VFRVVCRTSQTTPKEEQEERKMGNPRKEEGEEKKEKKKEKERKQQKRRERKRERSARRKNRPLPFRHTNTHDHCPGIWDQDRYDPGFKTAFK